MKQLPPLTAKSFIHGYWADPKGRRLTECAPPSFNMFIDSAGKLFTRPGIEDTEVDLNNASHAAEGLWIKEYNVTFFAFDNALKYCDHENADVVYDTGLTVTAESTLSTYNGCLYITNPTDGVTRIALTRLDSAATTSSVSFNIEDGTIFRFEITGSLRIKGTNEPYQQPTPKLVQGAANNGSGLIRITSTTAHGLATGYEVNIANVTGTTEANGDWTVTVIDSTNFDLQGSTFANAFVSGGDITPIHTDIVVLTGTSSQNYDAGDFAIQVYALSDLEKFKKIVFWNECMHGFGQPSSTTSQAAKRTLSFGDFFDAGDWQTIEDFTGGLSGTEGVGRSGVLTNGLAVNDYLYLFTTDETYSIATSGISRTSGARPPVMFSPKYGCLNHRSAADMDGRIVFTTQNKRIIRSQVNQGGLLEPDEKFDAPVRPLLRAMDSEQPFALTFYWEEANYLLNQLHIGGQIMTLIYDNNPIDTDEGSTPGRWLPPVLNWQVKNYFVRDGRLFGTDITDDTVYEFGVGESDDGADIDWCFATGEIEITSGRTSAKWGDWEVSGGMTQGTVAEYVSKVNGEEGQPKEFDSMGLNFGSSVAVGEVQIGHAFTPGTTAGSPFADFDKSFRIAPKRGRSFQAILRGEGDGQAIRVDSWRLPKVKYHPTSVLTSV